MLTRCRFRLTFFRPARAIYFILLALVIFCVPAQVLLAADAPRHIPLALGANDVLPTGNEWIALPEIRASDGAIVSFNVLSMRDRGLLEVRGESGTPALQPYFMVDGKPLQFRNPTWELIEYWIPVAHLCDGWTRRHDHLLCSSRIARSLYPHDAHKPPGRGGADHFGHESLMGALDRVTYLPVALRGERSVTPAPWVDSAEVFPSSPMTRNLHGR